MRVGRELRAAIAPDRCAPLPPKERQGNPFGTYKTPSGVSKT